MMIVIVMEMHDAFLLITLNLKQHHSTLPGQSKNLSNL